MSDTKLNSYLMTHDSGFAPNPFHGHLTLTTFMTDIRRTKMLDQWGAGFASKALVKTREFWVYLVFGMPCKGAEYLHEKPLC